MYCHTWNDVCNKTIITFSLLSSLTLILYKHLLGNRAWVHLLTGIHFHLNVEHLMLEMWEIVHKLRVYLTKHQQ